MPRLVKKTAHAPMKVGDKFICMCGLSKDQPFCDKSHLKTIKEDESKLYWYENGKAEEIVTEPGECNCEECKEEKACCDEGDCKCGGKGDSECKGDCSGENYCGNCKK